MENKWENKNFFEALKNAMNGVVYVVKNGKNIKIQIVIAILVFIAAIVLKFTNVELAILVLICFFIFALEFINTVIERLADLYTTEYNEKVKVIKDVAAGTVAIIAIASIIIGILLFIPKIIDIIK